MDRYAAMDRIWNMRAAIATLKPYIYSRTGLGLAKQQSGGGVDGIMDPAVYYSSCGSCGELVASISVHIDTQIVLHKVYLYRQHGRKS